MQARFDVSDNTKALQTGLNALKEAGKSGLLYSCDPASGRLHYQVVVSQAHLDAGLSALQLAFAFGEQLGSGAKSGGKDAAAMGSAPLPSGSWEDGKLAEAALSLVNLKLH